ncbi:DUF664 domain-containing protein [Nonomuraea sp. NEAU-A123]|uniref:mycothiol transferase n=1 Tax=Nonomuraea sp. NEAU-A123 TaxID=2839649 RepID=UPI001BE3E5A0|nr:DUF664 domain-containing protein [Nonomuraea sp. NEAU-A123]MBT2231265.1 DUF664 domain-containing protein [Nonomuraea sp. NEAU-A123]
MCDASRASQPFSVGAQCERSNAVLAATPLSTPPQGHHPSPLGDEVTELRRIVLHMIEETARHAGHLDVARELLDGKDETRVSIGCFASVVGRDGPASSDASDWTAESAQKSAGPSAGQGRGARGAGAPRPGAKPPKKHA